MKKLNTNTFVFKIVESILVIVYILFEELIWNIFAKPIFLYLKGLIVLDSLKQVFLQMNRYPLLAVFFSILLLTEALGLLSGIFFISGQVYLGISVYILKIPIAAFTFWLFDLTKDKLLTFEWLKTCYEFIMDLIDKLINSSIHIYIRSKILSYRHSLKNLVKKYFGEESIFAATKKRYIFIREYFRNAS